MSEASVGDVIVLTDDVTARTRVNVLICVPVRVTLPVSSSSSSSWECQTSSLTKLWVVSSGGDLKTPLAIVHVFISAFFKRAGRRFIQFIYF